MTYISPTQRANNGKQTQSSRAPLFWTISDLAGVILFPNCYVGLGKMNG